MKNLLIAALTLSGTYGLAHLASAESLDCGDSTVVGKVTLWQYECVDGYSSKEAAEAAALARVTDMMSGAVQDVPVCTGECWAPFIGYYTCTGGLSMNPSDPNLEVESGFDPASRTWWACVTTTPGESAPLDFSCQPCLVSVTRP